MQFNRNPAVPKLARYDQYRPYLRTDFRRHCAYCTGHEDEWGGEDHFEIDHHRPKSKNPELEHEYSNLYYCCRGCNKKGAKGEHWPSDALLAAGFRFFDPVAENADGLHFAETADGTLRQLNNVGVYSIENLRLNREALVKLRLNRKRMAALLSKELKALEVKLLRMQKKGKTPSPELSTRLESLRRTLQNAPVLAMLPGWWHD